MLFTLFLLFLSFICTMFLHLVFGCFHLVFILSFLFFMFFTLFLLFSPHMMFFTLFLWCISPWFYYVFILFCFLSCFSHNFYGVFCLVFMTLFTFFLIMFFTLCVSSSYLDHRLHCSLTRVTTEILHNYGTWKIFIQLWRPLAKKDKPRSVSAKHEKIAQFLRPLANIIIRLMVSTACC